MLLADAMGAGYQRVLEFKWLDHNHALQEA